MEDARWPPGNLLIPRRNPERSRPDHRGQRDEPPSEEGWDEKRGEMAAIFLRFPEADVHRATAVKPGRSGPFPYRPINRRPRITWPGGARVALWVIPNIETFPLDEPVPGGTGQAPDLINWAPRDYGNRVGVLPGDGGR